MTTSSLLPPEREIRHANTLRLQPRCWATIKHGKQVNNGEVCRCYRNNSITDPVMYRLHPEDAKDTDQCQEV